MQRNEPHPIPIPFILTDATKTWLAREYPQIDEVKTTEVFENKMSNAIDYEKRSPYFGQQVHALNWQRKFLTYVRIAMTNKWTGSIVTKAGAEIDTAWQEVMKFATDLGYPLQDPRYARRPADTANGFRSRIKSWEANDRNRNVLQFELKQMVSK